jgi:type I restriction enzyme M protein
MGNDYEVRKYLINTDRIRAIVTLPPHLFPGTLVPVSVLLLGRAEEKDLKRKVVFVDLSDHGAGLKTNRHLTPEAIETGIRCVTSPGQTDNSISRIVDHSDIAENDYNLLVAHYVRPRRDNEFQSLDNEVRLFVVATEKRNHAEAKAINHLDNLRKSMFDRAHSETMEARND